MQKKTHKKPQNKTKKSKKNKKNKTKINYVARSFMYHDINVKGELPARFILDSKWSVQKRMVVLYVLLLTNRNLNLKKFYHDLLNFELSRFFIYICQ